MNIVKKISSKRYLVISLQLLLFAAIYFGVRHYTQRNLVQVNPPILNATLLSGEAFNLQAANGSPRLLHFWASWCSVCKFEQDGIESLSKNNAVITVAMQSGGSAELQYYMQTENLSFPVIADPNGDIAKRFGVKAVPVSFILNKQGKIVFTESGYTSNWGLQVRLWLAQFL